MLSIKEFINKLNTEQIYGERYNFYMIVEEEKHKIEPVWNIEDFVDNIILDSNDDIYECFSITQIVNANYIIEEVD